MLNYTLSIRIIIQKRTHSNWTFFKGEVFYYFKNKPSRKCNKGAKIQASFSAIIYKYIWMIWMVVLWGQGYYYIVNKNCTSVCTWIIIIISEQKNLCYINNICFVFPLIFKWRLYSGIFSLIRIYFVQTIKILDFVTISYQFRTELSHKILLTKIK